MKCAIKGLLTTSMALLLLVVLLPGQGAEPPATTQQSTTPLSFAERKRNSILASGGFSSYRGMMSNARLVMEERIAAVNLVTPQSLERPRMVASIYFPEPLHGPGVEGKGLGLFAWWVENRMTLEKVIIRNPETEKEIVLSVPDEALHDKDASREDRAQFVHAWLLFIPTDFVTSRSQVLQIRVPGQEEAARCYPAVRYSRLPTSQAATQP